MVEGPVSNRRFSRRQIRTAIITAACVLAVIIIGGGGWAWYLKLSGDAVKAEQETIQALARDFAAQLQKNLEGTSGRLKALATADETIALFEQGDDAALEAAAEENKRLFKQALKLRYIKPGAYKKDDVSVPPLGYASLSMLRTAETTDRINTEVHLPGLLNQHIVMVRRVSNKAFELIGLLHLSLDVALFDELMADLKPGDGYIELAPRARADDLILARAGNAHAKRAEGTTVGINNTGWVITYWPGGGIFVAGGSGATSGLPVIPIILLFVLAGVAGLIFIKIRGGSASTEDSLITYEGAVRAIAEGSHVGVEQLIPFLPKTDRTTVNPKPISRGLNVDDATIIGVPPVAAGDAAAQAVFADKDTPDGPAAVAAEPVPEKQASVQQRADIARGIFRAYDIRGIAGETLTDDAVYEIARALGTRAQSLGQQQIVVGRDGRNSSPELSEALITGLNSTGADVIDIGLVPTPVLYFATHHFDTGSGVMITGSHNAPEYNGLKIMLGGNTLSGADIQDLYALTLSGEYSTGQGEVHHDDISADYIRRIVEDITAALGGSLKIVVDCGNGAAGAIAPKLLNAVGHDVVELYCDIDGNFPNHHPDPSQPENLQSLVETVKTEGADIGFAFDGDGDRLGVVDNEGNIIWPDRQLMLLAKDVLSRNRGAQIIFDVKCSRYLKSIIETSGGKPLMWKTGHSFIKNKMQEIDAPLAGEMSGHIFFKERWYGFDDAMYTAARLVEIITNAKQKPAAMFAELPDGVSTPELRLPLAEDEHIGFMEELAEKLSPTDADIIDIDGLRIEYSYGWGLARPSNTSPFIILRFEGEDAEKLRQIQHEFATAILAVLPDAKLPFNANGNSPATPDPTTDPGIAP